MKILFVTLSHTDLLADPRSDEKGWLDACFAFRRYHKLGVVRLALGSRDELDNQQQGILFL